MSIIATVEHNLEHNSPFFRVMLKSLILDFRSRMCQPLSPLRNDRELTKYFLLFCQVIAMIKGLYGLIVRLEPVFSEVIKRCIHTEIQEFVQVYLREPLRKASKSKKSTLLKT